MRKPVVIEAMQTTVLLSSARILRRLLETWGKLLLLKPWNNTIFELGSNTEKDFGDLRKLVVTEAIQTTVLLSSTRILRMVLETWGNLLLLKQYKLQYYWARPELWERFWRLEETCYWSHANYSIIEPNQNIEKYFGDLRKLVVTEAMQTTLLVSSARIQRRILETWGNLLLLNPCKLQYYWARPEYWEETWSLEETCCYWSHANYSIIELGQNTERIFETCRNLLLLKPCKLHYYWSRPDDWEGFQRLVKTCCYWNHANYSIIEPGQNTEKDFGDLMKLVVTEAMQTTVLLILARILRRVLDTWAKLLLLKQCKLQNYWARPEYWEGFWRFQKLVVTDTMQTTVLFS